MAEVVTIEKLDVMIKREQQNKEKLAQKKAEYEEKIKEIDEKINQSDAKIDEYIVMQNAQRYKALTSAAAAGGIDIDDILMALQTGDLLSLQERIEAQKANGPAAE